MAVAAATLTPARVWWSAVRPATLAASVSPVLVGTAIAVHEGAFRWWAGLAALAIAVAMQLGVNFANDYSDFVRGADRARVGPVRAASSGVVDPAQVRGAAITALGSAGLVGVLVSLAVDWRLLIVGATCLLAGWLYTGGPRPYGYLGLGEIFVFVFFGLVATAGTVYLETSRITPLAVLMGCGVGLIATAILVLNNLRDIDTDAAAGKRTLATRIGRAATHNLLIALVVVAFLVPFGALLTGGVQITVLLPVCALPIAVAPLRATNSAAPASLTASLKQMAAAELAYALFFTAGILL